MVAMGGRRADMENVRDTGNEFSDWPCGRETIKSRGKALENCILES